MTLRGAADAVEGWGRALFEGIDDAVFVHDLDGNIIDANGAACRRLGYTRDELLRLNTRDIDDPEFAGGFEQRLHQQLSAGGVRCEGRHRTKDGRVIIVDINSSAIQIAGQPCVLAVMRDITQHKYAEQALRKQTNLLRSVLDNMAGGVVVADEHEQLLACNPAAERLFGMSFADLAAFPCAETPGLFLPDRLTPFPPQELPLRRSIGGEQVDDVEMFIRPPHFHEGRWVSVTGTPLRDESGKARGGVMVCRDITDRKVAECRQAAQYGVARALANADALKEVTPAILGALCENLGWDLAVLWAVDRQSGVLRCVDLWYTPPQNALSLQEIIRTGTFQRGVGVPGQVWETGEPVWIADLSAAVDDRVGLPAAAAGMRATFAFPAWGRGEITGVLEAFGLALQQPDDQVLAMAATLGSQIGQFLERQHIDKELRESQAFYHSLVECVPLNIFRKDRDGRVTFGNQRYCAILHRSLEELVGKTDYDLFPEALARKYRDDDRRVLEQDITLDIVEEHHLPDGERIYVQVIKTPIHDAHGHVIGTQGMFWDVTARKRAEEELTRSERRYRQLTEATLDAIIVSDQDGKVLMFNPAAERLFGYRAEEVVGGPLTVLMPQEYWAQHDHGLQRYAQTRVPRIVGKTVEMYGRRKDGTEFPVELALSAFDTAEGAQGGRAHLQFLGALRDLTERNRMRSVLVQNEKLASIGLLSAGVAHEINNPLAFIGNNLAVLDRDSKGLVKLLDLYESRRDLLARADPELAAQITALADEMDVGYIRDNLGRLLARTRDGVDRVTRIVHSLRGLARTDRPHLQDTPIPDLVEMSVEIVRSRLRRNAVAVETEYDAEPVVRCVPTQISQVLLNLLMNAVQAIEAARREGGRIVVRVRRLSEHMLIEVSDNGCGIMAEHLPRLFDPFFTTKDVGEGTGLGLSICHNIVTGHGGHIEVESTPGKGSAFRVFLPLHAQRESHETHSETHSARRG